ncbi:MAG: MFS transporter [Pseudomonadota bacterium]
MTFDIVGFMPRFLNTIDRTLRPEGHVFYGWWIAVATGGIHLLSSLLWMQSYGAYVVLLQQEFGWSKTIVAGAFALTRIESGLLGPIQGWLVDRLGPRIILQVGMVLYGIGFMLFSQVESVLTFYLTFALMAVGSSLGGFATVMVAVVSWFRRHRSKAVAISSLGFSLGGLCVPIVVFALEGWGWRTTAFVSGVIILVVGLPLAHMIRHRPETYGEVVDGIREPDAGTERDGASRPALRRDLTAREAMRTSSFWLISAGHGIALLSVSSLMVHLIPHLTASPMAFTLAAAGGVVALMTGSQVIGQLLGGFLGDRFNKRLMCTGCLIGHGAGVAMLTFAATPWVAMFAVVVHGLAWGVRGPLMTAIRADYFGSASFGTIMGFSSLIVMFGMTLGPIFSGLIADRYGDYDIAFLSLALVSMLGAVCFFASRPPAVPT